MCRNLSGNIAENGGNTIHMIHKCHFSYEYIAVEYRQPGFVNFQCVLIIVDIIQVSCCLNMAQVKCLVSSTVDFSQ